MEDLMDFISGERYFSNIYLKSGYHHIQIRERDEWNTVFKTKDGLFEWMVMSFGLTNTPRTFMILTNEVLKPFWGMFVIMYLDDILIFSRSKEAHLGNVKQVLERLKAKKLKTNLEKCIFLQEELVYLGFIVCKEVLKMDPEKVKSIVDSLIPICMFDVRNFHGLEVFTENYHKFSDIYTPLTKFMKKGDFQWTTATTKFFQALKKKVTKHLVLAFPNFSMPV
jgi:hypothetical protein